MTVCTDVYVRPQTCNAIRIYPSQIHPLIPDSGGGGSKHYVPDRPARKRRHIDTDEDILAVLGLL